MNEDRHFQERLGSVNEKIDTRAPDMGFGNFLKTLKTYDGSAVWLSKEFVEGFHAAPTDQMSVHALAKAEAAADREAARGTRQFHLVDGGTRN